MSEIDKEISELEYNSFETFDNEFEDTPIGIDNIEDTGVDFFNDIKTDDTEIHINVPVKSKDKSEIAKNVEDTLISFLSEERGLIPILVGDLPNCQGDIPEDTLHSFISQYGQAVLYNPAIKWYSKLVNVLPEEKFNYSSGQLNLKMGFDLFNKIIYPFFNDFMSELRDESLIVDVMYSLAEALFNLNKDDKLKRVLDFNKSEEASEEGDLKVSEINVLDSLIDSEEDIKEADALLRIEPDAINFEEVKDINRSNLKISLSDLSNKYIAEYFIEENSSAHDIASRLSEEGFKKQRINEIVGIYNFIKLEGNLKSRLKPKSNKNLGVGDTDFGFEV
jgi:hypothetical protein